MQYTLRTVNEQGETINESTLELKEGDILIQKVSSHFNAEQAKEAHDHMIQALESNPSLITLFNGVSLQVLSIK